MRIYTVGHSNGPVEAFVDLLRSFDIQTVVDVRSRPYSTYVPHFNRESLSERLRHAGLTYRFAGDKLGGHPDADDLYHHDRAAYERIASLGPFRAGIDEVVELAETTVLALMCTEEDPSKCHRHPLLARTLVERDLQVLHIRRDRTTEDAAEMLETSPSAQLPLFEPPGEDLSWKSPKRIRR